MTYNVSSGTLSLYTTTTTRRPRAHHRVSPYPGARRQNETEIFSDHDKTSRRSHRISFGSIHGSDFCNYSMN